MTNLVLLSTNMDVVGMVFVFLFHYISIKLNFFSIKRLNKENENSLGYISLKK